MHLPFKIPKQLSRLRRRKIHLNLSQTMAITYFLIILLGTVLLMLPVSSVNRESCGMLTALFTATSCVCVTGLSLVDLWSTFSRFGQVVILLLIQIGGLGFMSMISILFHIMNRKSDLRSLMLMAESLGSDGLKHIGRIQKRLVLGSLLFEGIGALILFAALVPTLGVGEAIWFGIFHSVSAFCNAGFDLMGKISPGSSLTLFAHNPVVLITIALLITIGGIGFIVWDDIANQRNPRNWTVNTKLVLNMTGSLLFAGCMLFFLMEYHNPQTLGALSFRDKIVNAFFQSATLRTGGFAGIDQSQFTGASTALSILFMAIGGSAGSTAGGVKTLTFMVLIISIFSNVFGKKTVTIMRRTVTQEQISYAWTVCGSFFLLTFIGGILVDLTSPAAGFLPSFYECVSALATVGMSLGYTASFSLFAKLILITFMFIGRVGLLTLTFGFLKTKEDPAIKYPPIKIMVG